MNHGLVVDDILAMYPGASRLGGGAQKQVWSVDDPHYGPCVLKIGAYPSPDILERISREVAVLRGLRSDRFPRCYDFQVVDDHRFFILEERIDGEPLSCRLAQYTEPAVAVRLVTVVAGGLVDLWAIRVVHRDVKPANLIIARDGQPRIIDLGIARLLDDTSLTRSHAPWGPCTPNYAAPEQLENRKNDISHRTDQFALGIILAQLLLGGTHPFEPTQVGGPSIPENILTGRWARTAVGTRSGEVVVVVGRMLGSQPHERYRRPQDLMAALATIGG